MTPRRPRLALVVALAASLAAVASTPRALADVIERVVAVVDEDAIFYSELRERAAPFLPQVMSAGTETERLARLAELYRQLLDVLIDEHLIAKAAEAMDVRVSNDDVEGALRNVQAQNGLTPEEFWEAVHQQGFSEAQYRIDLRRQLLRYKVMNTRVRGRVNITEADVRRRYDEAVREANRELRFRASHIFVSVPEGAPATTVAQVRAEAERIRQGLDVPGFERAMSRYGGGDLGWLSQGDLPAPLESALLAMQPGEISEPVRGPSGFHIFLLHERERGGSNIPPFDDVKDQIFREMLNVAMQRQEQVFLEELRRDAVISRHL